MRNLLVEPPDEFSRDAYETALREAEALNAGEQTARLLATTIGSALFFIERTTWIGRAPITTVQAVATPGYQLWTQS